VSCAAKLALEDSGILLTEESCRSMGVSIGATYGSLHSISQFDRSGLIEGPRSVNPSHFPNTVLNSPASQVSIRFKLKGFNTTVSTGFCAGLDAVCYAVDQLQLQRAETALAGGVEELCEENVMAFHALGWLSGSDGAESICCPFDSRRNGFLPGEGSAVVVLEDQERARRRGARIQARILGYASAFAPPSGARFDSQGEGLEAAVRAALDIASLSPGEIGHVCAAANSTRDLDAMEARALARIFGTQAAHVRVSAIKSMIGEACSASGALQLAAAAGILQRRLLPPTVNYRVRDPECDLDVVTGSAPADIRNVLVLASDAHGANTAVILGREGA
jgi:3-oxoacyl-[acyl-carrier-protein] synthase II